MKTLQFVFVFICFWHSGNAQWVIKEYAIQTDAVGGDNVVLLDDHTAKFIRGSDRGFGIHIIEEPTVRWERKNDSLIIFRNEKSYLYFVKTAFQREFLVSEKDVAAWHGIEKRLSDSIAQIPQVISVTDSTQRKRLMSIILPNLLYLACLDNPNENPVSGKNRRKGDNTRTIYVEVDPNPYAVKKINRRDKIHKKERN